VCKGFLAKLAGCRIQENSMGVIVGTTLWYAKRNQIVIHLLILQNKKKIINP